MDADRWQKIEQLYHAAREHDEGDRRAFLEQACAGDAELRREIESLLACEKDAKGFLNEPAMEQAAEALAAEQVGGSSSDKIMIGRSISHYRILAEVGHGGMGVPNPSIAALGVGEGSAWAAKTGCSLRPQLFGDGDLSPRRLHGSARTC